MEELCTIPVQFHGAMGPIKPHRAAVRIKRINGCKSTWNSAWHITSALYNYSTEVLQYSYYNNNESLLLLGPGPRSATLKKLFNLFKPVSLSLKQGQYHTHKWL